MDTMNILEKLVKKAAANSRTVIYPEGDEERTLRAALRAGADAMCVPVLVSPHPAAVADMAATNGLDISQARVLSPSLDLLDQAVLRQFTEQRMAKGLSEREAHALAREPLHFSSLYVASGKADACVAGARSSTADVLRAALHGIGTAPGIKIISSYFLMVPPAGHALVKHPLIYADCAVNPVPGGLALHDIAVATVGSFKSLFPDETARVAFLSFSTKGSADHSSLKKVREALSLAQETFAGDPSVVIDGEMQFDAALDMQVAQRKTGDSAVAGKANILIFPDLNAGNIGYKITERLGGFRAIGPVTQGLAKPFSDLSRGCSVDDIYYVTAVVCQ